MDKHSSYFSLSPKIFAPMQNFKMIVLLVDDQKIIVEAVKRLLQDQSDITLHSCLNAAEAVALANDIKPTVILQDLIMPEIDGLQLVKLFRENQGTKDVPIVVLSTEEDPRVKAEAFTLGANDYMVKLPDRLELIARIRYHSQAYILLLERNEAFRRLKESQAVLEQELAEAAAYVTSLLPQPSTSPIKIDWRFITSTQLGGDAFGYHWLDERHFAIYLFDVCGHGVGAALHSISVMNVLRAENLPKADFTNPGSVLTALNAIFQMEDHNNMFLTIWYGVYDKETRQLTYANGGHPSPILVTNGKVQELVATGVAIGILADTPFENATCQIAQDTVLYLFSDGVFEIPKPDQSIMTFPEFKDLLIRFSQTKNNNLDVMVETIRKIQQHSSFADDFSFMRLCF